MKKKMTTKINELIKQYGSSASVEAMKYQKVL
ncbi:hypothetical protein PF002_g32484 [Phytophthora fragariae]|uniref:Uncharacterized protein n=1 Tax=Phytophthora fragariae TaxID=53985 RepID=A0A6A3PKH3_9STRA|nr:hypothetical protein PF003_g11298 [Phytophthora fragariae]KAE9056773.1 hypothetical protein PF007_g31877 [Phytophthora fragariae]KAE9058115.1 hypothetical protein PF006_g32236 [Phytophthora fragariae]KAE9161016.1 hypothetical protein PF002_g32484 [Phytophthora fragariae]